METEILGPLMAIGGFYGTGLRSVEVLNSSCDFPLPEARSGHISVTTTDGKTLVCGGVRDESSFSPFTCLQFDYESKSWKEHSQLLSKHRHFASTVTLSRGTYLLGGTIDAMSSSEFLATGSSVWTQGPRIPGAGVRESCAAKLSDTEFVIFGGKVDRTQAWVYSETSGEWREWPRLTVGVIAHTCMGLGDIVLMAGGYDETKAFIGRTVIFDAKTGSAREVASLNYPRGGAAMVLYGGKPLILGGWDRVARVMEKYGIWIRRPGRKPTYTLILVEPICL